MKLKHLTESEFDTDKNYHRGPNARDEKVNAELNRIAAKYELKIQPLALANEWFKKGAWYCYALTTAHGWKKERDSELDLIPIEIRWRGFKRDLIKYAKNLSETCVVAFTKTQAQGWSIGAKLHEPEETDLSEMEDAIEVRNISTTSNPNRLVFAMYVSDLKGGDEAQ